MRLEPTAGRTGPLPAQPAGLAPPSTDRAGHPAGATRPTCYRRHPSGALSREGRCPLPAVPPEAPLHPVAPATPGPIDDHQTARSSDRTRADGSPEISCHDRSLVQHLPGLPARPFRPGRVAARASNWVAPTPTHDVGQLQQVANEDRPRTIADIPKAILCTAHHREAAHVANRNGRALLACNDRAARDNLGLLVDCSEELGERDLRDVMRHRDGAGGPRSYASTTCSVTAVEVTSAWAGSRPRERSDGTPSGGQTEIDRGGPGTARLRWRQAGNAGRNSPAAARVTSINLLSPV